MFHRAHEAGLPGGDLCMQVDLNEQQGEDCYVFHKIEFSCEGHNFIPLKKDGNSEVSGVVCPACISLLCLHFINMKKLLYTLSISVSLQAQAQIHIGSNEIAVMNKPGGIGKETLAAFKKTTTLFTLPYADYVDVTLFEKAISAVWTITPFKIIKPEELSNYTNKDGFSIFSFGGYMMNRGTGGGPMASNLHMTYDLWMPGVKKKSKQEFFARVQLHTDPETFVTAIRNSGKRNDDFSRHMLNYLYNDALIYNWGPGFLKGYLKKINDQLSEHKERGPFSEETDKQTLRSLLTDTLFIPDYVLLKTNAITGDETFDNTEEDEELKKAYPYPVKILSSKELNHRIVNSTQPIKYLVYTRSSTDKFINVFESNGKLLYARYVKISYNFKNKDLSKLAKTID
jgi:hypothetical protein